MTREELKQLSDETFFDNNNGEIQPSGHRNFNNQMIDSLAPVFDTGSSEEQLTGEMYDGKPVYSKCWKDVLVNAGTESNSPFIIGSVSDYKKVWLDVEKSGYSGDINSLILKKFDDHVGGYLDKRIEFMGNNTYLVFIGGNDRTTSIYRTLIIKYTKA